jgi:hypothetical protein
MSLEFFDTHPFSFGTEADCQCGSETAVDAHNRCLSCQRPKRPIFSPFETEPPPDSRVYHNDFDIAVGGQITKEALRAAVHAIDPLFFDPDYASHYNFASAPASKRDGGLPKINPPICGVCQLEVNTGSEPYRSGPAMGGRAGHAFRHEECARLADAETLAHQLFVDAVWVVAHRRAETLPASDEWPLSCSVERVVRIMWARPEYAAQRRDAEALARRIVGRAR